MYTYSGGYASWHNISEALRTSTGYFCCAVLFRCFPFRVWLGRLRLGRFPLEVGTVGRLRLGRLRLGRFRLGRFRFGLFLMFLMFSGLLFLMFTFLSESLGQILTVDWVLGMPKWVRYTAVIIGRVTY